VNARNTGRKANNGLAVAFAAVCLGAGGCSTFWDDVTSRDFKLSMWFNKPSPMVVLRDSTDGDQRAKAMRNLKEPLPNGGDQRDQDVVVDLLTTAALSDGQIVCRQAAVYALRSFKDPRAVEALKEAYYRASAFKFNPETVTILRCQILEALGENGQPQAVELLVRVVREPPVEGPEQDKQQNMDERIAAARALGHFRHNQAAEALVGVLQKDQDVALRNRAKESLTQITNKDLPADYQTWADFLNSPDGGKAVVAGDGDANKKVFGVIPASWWK
jgi:HEAT repeat protein